MRFTSVQVVIRSDRNTGFEKARVFHVYWSYALWHGLDQCQKALQQ